MAALFSEELGLVLEVAADREAEVLEAYLSAGLAVASIGRVTEEATISIAVAGQESVAGETFIRLGTRASLETQRRPWKAVGTV